MVEFRTRELAVWETEPIFEDREFPEMSSPSFRSELVPGEENDLPLSPQPCTWDLKDQW